MHFAGTTSPSLTLGRRIWSSATGLQQSTQSGSAGYSDTTIRLGHLLGYSCTTFGLVPGTPSGSAGYSDTTIRLVHILGYSCTTFGLVPATPSGSTGYQVSAYRYLLRYSGTSVLPGTFLVGTRYQCCGSVSF